MASLLFAATLLVAGIDSDSGAAPDPAAHSAVCLLESYREAPDGGGRSAAPGLTFSLAPGDQMSQVVNDQPELPVTLNARLEQLCFAEGATCLDLWVLHSTFSVGTTQSGAGTGFKLGEPLSHHQSFSHSGWHASLTCTRDSTPAE